MTTTPEQTPKPAEETKPLPKFEAARVEGFFGPARVAKLKGLSNGRYDEHLAAVCLERDDLAQVVLEVTRRCGVPITQDERTRLELPLVMTLEERKRRGLLPKDQLDQLTPAAAPVAASGSDQAAPAQAPADDAAGES